ncbi:MAG: hypothetical protein GX375_07730 [Clostridiales bacterium]|mgnify:CR=1 FL=1|nr:hypothetical protein [Clostridiales bacterium]
MRTYSKLMLGILLTLAIMIVSGCSSVTLYQNSIFDDEKKIAKDADSYLYVSRVGSKIEEGKENENHVKFIGFTGMDTIYKINSQGENDLLFTFESTIEDGAFKVVLVSPDDKILNIVDDTKEGNQTVKITEGVSRVKLVGKKAKGEISIKIDWTEGVDIKRVD